VPFVTDLIFSPDGKHAAYVARRGTPLNPGVDSVVVLDGKEGKSYRQINVGTLRISPDGRRLAFVATVPNGRNPNDGVERVVVDGVEVTDYDKVLSPPLFSPDGKHFAYAVGRWRDAKKFVVVVDGKEGKTYEGTVSDLTFSPDGRHLAYRAATWTSSRFMMVVDGKAGAECDVVSDFQFGADGTRFAYVARKGLTEVCVTDAGEERASFQITDLLLSPDGKHVAYKALRTDGHSVVRDGKEGKPYFQILDHSLRFSPDGQRLAYMAMLPGGLTVVADGLEGKGYGYNGFIPSLAFSPDGRHLAYVATRADTTGVVVVDGVESPSFDRALEAPVVFDGPNRLHVLAVRGPNLIRMEIEMRE
jgi:Tol biopolymer transport system component